MKNDLKDTSLQEDKAIMHAIVDEQLLNEFDKNTSTISADYFDQFSERVLENIKNQTPSTSFKLISIGRLSIAAAILFIVATTFIFLNNNNQPNDLAAIGIHEIPTSEIDSYVNENEWIAEIDVTNEINKMNVNFETSTLSKDSSN